MDIKEKIVIVTGASSGIGLATARLLTKQGAKVALVARSKKELEKISQTLPNSLAIAADLSKEAQIRKMVKKTVKHFGRVDILINNAGRGYDSPVSQINPKNYRYLFELNLMAPLIGIQEVIPIMRKQGQGVIINISSGTTFLNIPGIEAYASLKRALNGLSLTAREELKDQGISVCLVYPSTTSSDFYKNKLNKSNPGAKQFYSQGDSSEYVAEKILEAIKTEKAEVKAHEWMGKA